MVLHGSLLLLKNYTLESAKQEWIDIVGPDVALSTDQSIQVGWDLPLCQKKYDDMLTSSKSNKEKARLLAVASPHSGV